VGSLMCLAVSLRSSEVGRASRGWQSWICRVERRNDVRMHILHRSVEPGPMIVLVSRWRLCSCSRSAVGVVCSRPRVELSIGSLGVCRAGGVGEAGDRGATEILVADQSKIGWVDDGAKLA